MEQKNGLSFNCAESVLIGVQKESSVPGCQTSCLKIASVLGGGIAGLEAATKNLAKLGHLLASC